MKRFFIITLSIIAMAGGQAHAAPKKKASPKASRKIKSKPRTIINKPTKKNGWQFSVPTYDFKTLLTATSMGIMSGIGWTECAQAAGGIPASSQYLVGNIFIEKPLAMASQQLLGNDSHQLAFSCAYFLASNTAYYLSQYVENPG